MNLSATNKMRALVYFLAVWFSYGLFVNSENQNAYTLQQMGVDSVVTYKTFSLGHSQLPVFKPGGDTFSFDGAVFAAKQPGQFLIGAAAYAPLKILGISYEANYALASALVTWLTAGLLTALAGAAIFLLVSTVWEKSAFSALLIAMCFNFGTVVFPYAGVEHHDAMASSILLFSFAFLEFARKKNFQRDPFLFVFWGGFFLGATLFVSMLPFFPVVCVAISFVLLCRSRFGTIATFLIGGTAGILPLLLHNWHYFGNPLMQPNIAGNFSDTFFQWNLGKFLERLSFYVFSGSISLLHYYPIMVFGVICAFIGLKEDKEVPAKLILCIFFSQLFYLGNIDTIGHCQFGPRYLMPLSGFCILPLVNLAEVKSIKARKVMFPIAGMLIAFSVFVGLSGAILGTMKCNIDVWLPSTLPAFVSQTSAANFPLLGLCLGLLSGMAGIIFMRRNALF